MVEQVERAHFFHVTRAVPYNDHPSLSVGDDLQSGISRNPFFGYFNSPIQFEVRGPDNATRKMPLLAWLREVANGNLTCEQNPLQTAYEVASHFQKLARELQMETIRLNVVPGAPSRHTCLWVTDRVEEAERWRSTLGSDGRLLELEVTGTIHRADAALLPVDALSLDALADNVRRYWLGEHTEDPHPEVLFAGNAKVLAEHAAGAIAARPY